MRPLQRIALLLLLFAAGPALAAPAALQDIRVWGSPDSTRVVLDLTAPASYTVFSLSDPERIVIDFDSIDADVRKIELPPASGVVKAVRVGARGRRGLRLSRRGLPLHLLRAVERQLVLQLREHALDEARGSAGTAVRLGGDCIGRRERGGRRRIEFGVLSAIAGSGVPAPRARWLDATGEALGRPAIIMDRRPRPADPFVLPGAPPAPRPLALAARG